MSKTLTIGALAAVCGMALTQPASAALLSGDLWAVPEAVAQDAVPGNVPAAPPDVSFSSPYAIGFGLTNVPNYTVNDFLVSGGATNVSEHTPGALARIMDDFSLGTLFRLTGLTTITTGQTFTIDHDDGLTLTIGGWSDSSLAGPHSPGVDTLTYTGPSGTFPVSLVYGECCGPPAVLNTAIPAGPEVVSEPVRLGVASLLFGLLGLAFLRGRGASS